MPEEKKEEKTSRGWKIEEDNSCCQAAPVRGGLGPLGMLQRPTLSLGEERSGLIPALTILLLGGISYCQISVYLLHTECIALNFYFC